MFKVSVIGQGYVGFPLAVAIASIGYKVIGIDINVSLVAQLNKGGQRAPPGQASRQT
jgi:UDP-N-acetyl-D-mannosaminuronate dehydrogenase